MILLLDNYDSFVYNLQRYLVRLGQATEVVRSDLVDLEQIEAGSYAAIVISPGPRAPAQAGRSLEVVTRFHRRLPMLGVCLGHQAICQALGGRIVRAPRAVHGRSSPIAHTGSRLFAGLPSPFEAARYHSLVAEAASLPRWLRVTGTCPAEDGQPIVMAVEHDELPVFGVQFHPESILSEVGYRILANFLALSGLASEALPSADFATSEVWSAFQSTASTPPDFPPMVLPK